MAWKVAPIYPVGAELVHIFPLEGKEHQTDPSDQECWCSPRLETNPAGVVLVIHRDFNHNKDVRELKRAFLWWLAPTVA